MFLFLFQVSLPSVSCVTPPILTAHKRYRWHFYHEWEFSAMKFHVNLSSWTRKGNGKCGVSFIFPQDCPAGFENERNVNNEGNMVSVRIVFAIVIDFRHFFYHFVVRNKRFALPLYNRKVSVLYYMYYVLCIFYFPSKPLGRLRNCGRFGIANRVDERFAVGKA